MLLQGPAFQAPGPLAGRPVTNPVVQMRARVSALLRTPLVPPTTTLLVVELGASVPQVVAWGAQGWCRSSCKLTPKKALLQLLTILILLPLSPLLTQIPMSRRRAPARTPPPSLAVGVVTLKL